MIPLHSHDFQLLKDIHQQCFKEPWQDFRELLNDNYTFGWRYGEVGFILGRIIRVDVEILTFAVLPEYQKQGIGQKLLTTFLKDLQNVSIYLEVAINNRAAIELYTKNGFTIRGIRKGYYQHGQELPVDAYLMGLEKS